MRNGIGSCIVTGFLMGVGIALGIGCAGLMPSQPRYDYFSVPDASDAWSPKISGWQRREEADDGSFFELRSRLDDVAQEQDLRVPFAPAPQLAAADSSDAKSAANPDSDANLRDKYFDFRAERRRGLARSLAEWIQAQAPAHYLPDGPIDHWATFEETLRRNGDDCDGLELLVYHGLRDLGFGENEVYRAIVYRPSDGQHHMVTLWFEDPEDPWVIDPTGAMTHGMPRMSDLPEWVPLKVFGAQTEYTVRTQRGDASQSQTSLVSR
jgi:hypothetical protein